MYVYQAGCHGIGVIPTKRLLWNHRLRILGPAYPPPFDPAMSETLWLDLYNVGPPNVISWFISPNNYSYKYHKP